MDEIKVLYECDPEKNTECRKIMCFTKAGGRGSKCVCTATKNPEYAKKDQDGQPIISRLRLRVRMNRPQTNRSP